MSRSNTLSNSFGGILWIRRNSRPLSRPPERLGHQFWSASCVSAPAFPLLLLRLLEGSILLERRECQLLLLRGLASHRSQKIDGLFTETGLEFRS
jgi:hypothetical protein